MSQRADPITASTDRPCWLGAARSTNTALDRSERCRQNGSNFWGSTLLVAGPRPGKKTWADKHSNQRWGLGLAHRCSSLKLAIAFKGRVLKHPGHLHASAPCHPTGLGEAISATPFFVLGWPYAPKSCIDHSADYLAVIWQQDMNGLGRRYPSRSKQVRSPRG